MVVLYRVSNMKYYYNSIFYYCFLCIILLIGTVGSVNAQEQTGEEDRFSLSDLPLEIFGFVESRHGFRLSDDPYHSKSTVLSESRAQIDIDIWADWGEFNFKNDFIYDWHQGKYVNDLREFNFLSTPLDWVDIKLGRQILTWGKGDLIFINDLFPKDFQAFFIGRNIDYLKAPSDALKLTFYIPWFELTTVYIPRFNSDNFPTGTYLSYFNPFTGSFTGDRSNMMFDTPNDWFKDGEYHWQAKKSIKGWELAFYGYYGNWKSPAGIDINDGSIQFPSLQVHGLSLETDIGGGIATAEFGYYASTDDSDGTDFTIRNGYLAYLIGYTYDFKKDLKFGIQYYVEDILKYDEFISTSPVGSVVPNEWRDLITLRLTKLLNKQKLELSSFLYYSISDNDFYWRWNSEYKLNDFWKVNIGLNIFGGSEETTFWSQFQNNNNVYLGLRRSF